MPASSAEAVALIPILDAIPGPRWLLNGVLYGVFVLHLLLVNAVIGVSAITLKDAFRPGGRLSREQSGMLPKGLALAVNMAIPPFLILQALYGQFLYASAVLSALWLLAIMVVVMLAYYGLYLAMVQRGLSDNWRATALALALLLMLCNAFILVNAGTLMQHPEYWTAYAQNAGGLFLPLADPQILPRFLHFLLACPAVGGLCIALAAHYRLTRQHRTKSSLDTAELTARRNKGLAFFFYSTLAQVPVGCWFLLSLPSQQRALFMSGDALATTLFMLSLLLTGFALFSARHKRVPAAALSSLALVCLMVGMRSLLRAFLLAPYSSSSSRAFAAGPTVLFLASLVFTLGGIAWLVRVYRRQALLPVLEEPGSAVPSAGKSRQSSRPIPTRDDEEREIPVNEIASSPLDVEEEDGKERTAGSEPARNKSHKAMSGKGARR